MTSDSDPSEPLSAVGLSVRKQLKEVSGHEYKFNRFSIWYFLLFLLAVLAIQNYLDLRQFQVQTVSYSDFRQLVDLKGVKDLSLTNELISGKLTAAGVEFLTKDGKNPELAALVKQEGKAEPHFSSVRLEDKDLLARLDNAGISYTARMDKTWLTALLSWLLPMLLLMGVWIYFIRKIGAGAGGGLMSIGKSKAKFYVEDETKVTFKDVAGVEEAIEELQEIIEFLQNPGKFQSLGGKIPKGVLLVGPPGTGKTLLGRAVAGEAGVPFLSLTGSDFVEMFVGVGAARVRDLFAQAEEKAPCIIFIDELDAIGKARSVSPITGGHEERENTLNQLLSEMDGFDTRKGVIIMSATNRPEILDPALIRPGRFDRQIMVDRPSLKGREDILKVHVRGVKLGEDIDLHKIAARTPGMVGSDLANIVNEAALLAARKNKTAVGMDDFEEAIDRVMAGLGEAQPGDESQGKRNRRLPRNRPCPGGGIRPDRRPGASGLHHSPGHQRLGLHFAVAHRRSLPDDQKRTGRPSGRAVGWPGGRRNHF